MQDRLGSGSAALLLAIAAAGLLAVAQGSSKDGLQMAQAPFLPSGAAPARDGTVAVQEELDAARRAGTVDAYDLFLARHPDHALAATARRERARLANPEGPRR